MGANFSAGSRARRIVAAVAVALAYTLVTPSAVAQTFTGKIVLDEMTSGTQYGLFVTKAGPREPLLATTPGCDDRAPVWSPDGRQVAFISDRDPARPQQLFVLDTVAREAKPRQLTT